MPILLESSENSGYRRYRIVDQLDDKTRKKAIAGFGRYKLQGIIRECSFKDECWLLSDELMTYRISFSIDEKIYNEKAAVWTGCSYSCFTDCIKAYITFRLGQYGISRLREISKQLIKLAELSYEEAENADFADFTSHVLEFLQILPGEDVIRDQLMDVISDMPWKARKSNNSRKLAEFKYYLRFDKNMREFWQEASAEEKRTYFPIWIWWNLTSILPLRVTEFLMTPRNCISQKDDKYYLTIRRTQKKKAKRQVYYRIALDYKLNTYEIPEWMYREIANYISVTDCWEETNIGTLIRREIRTPSGYFTYVQMEKRLKDFCELVTGDREYPIHLGDTRHLAMISLILSGGSPVICRELAGHEDIEISSGYYSNISTVVESAVYETCKGYSEKSFWNGNLQYSVDLPKARFWVCDGWCDELKVQEGDIGECIKSYSETVGLGDCRNCQHYYPDSPVITAELTKEYKKAVDEDGQYLMQMIELVRKGLGYTEDIYQALLRIQNSSWKYGKLLWDKARGE